jgi:hypothetical protein
MTYCTDKSCTCDLTAFGLSTALVTDLLREDGPYGESEDWWGATLGAGDPGSPEPDTEALAGIEAWMEDELDISEFMPAEPITTQLSRVHVDSALTQISVNFGATSVQLAESFREVTQTLARVAETSTHLTREAILALSGETSMSPLEAGGHLLAEARETAFANQDWHAIPEPLVEVTMVRPGDTTRYATPNGPPSSTLDYYVLAPTATGDHYVVEAWLGEEVYHTHVYGFSQEPYRGDPANGVVGAIITITAHITALCGEDAISLLEWRCLQPVPQVLSTGS